MTETSAGRAMRRDAARCLGWTHGVTLLAVSLRLLAPIAASWLVGDMADALLALDRGRIYAQLPLFLCAMALTVAAVPLLDMAENLSMTRNGYQFEELLMGRLLRQPLTRLQSVEPGTLLERLTGDAPAFLYNQLLLHTRPVVLAACAAVYLALALAGDGGVEFYALVLVLACLPVARSAWVGQTRAELNRRNSEYAEGRKTLEQELYASLDFAWGYGLGAFLTRRLEDRFRDYMRDTGKAKAGLEARDGALDYLFDYGAQAGVVLLGAVLISLGRLTPGGLLSGVLMLPTVRKCCAQARRLVRELPQEKKHMARLSVFYGPEEAEDPQPIPAGTGLALQEASFTYPGQDRPVLDALSLSIGPEERIQFTGPNGSGKSTLLALLAGLYPPQSGAVTDQRGQPLPVGRLRRMVALCQQDGAIFSGAVADNLFLPEDGLEKAQALLAEMGFTKPMDYLVSPSGSNLSPGERKKLLLARALLQDRPFLALDEPLNHLDETGRRVLLARLEARGGGVLLISHAALLPPDTLRQIPLSHP